MGNNVNLFESMIEEAKADINSRLNGLVKRLIDIVFDYIEGKEKDLPETIKRLRNNPEIEQKIVDLCSEHPFEEGLVPKDYNGLPVNLWISNLHQDGYLNGLYIGYVLAMMALVDNDVPKDIILAARDYIQPNLMGHHYDDRDEFISQYKDEKYRWIDKS